MKLLIKKIAKTNLGIYLRNTFNIRPLDMTVYNLSYASVSDAFVWRTDNNFTTKFKYSDILDIFFKIKNSWVEFHFFSKDGKLIKIEKINNLNLSNELEINSKYLDGVEDYGTFYIYHYSESAIEEENIISNRCYLGYSQNQNLFSFVHGNTLAKFTKISNDGTTSSDIVKTSLLQNQFYKIQKYFEDFEKSELFFSNPTSKVIMFSVENKNYKLNPECSKIIAIKDSIITIKSNCLFFRPTVFNYKNNYIDVHHA